MSTADFYKPEREAQVLRKALERNKGPLRNEEIARLFREIMSACLAQQEPLKVAFLGPEGTFSQQAVLKHFGHSVRALPRARLPNRYARRTSGHSRRVSARRSLTEAGRASDTRQRYRRFSDRGNPGLEAGDIRGCMALDRRDDE